MEEKKKVCEMCNDTGYYGDNGPGKDGNMEYVECECKSNNDRAVFRKSDIIDAFNQGYREGVIDAGSRWRSSDYDEKDISEYDDAENYYNSLKSLEN